MLIPQTFYKRRVMMEVNEKFHIYIYIYKSLFLYFILVKDVQVFIPLY